MPSFVSNKGKWYPAKEKIGLTNKSDDVLSYDGEDIKPGEPFVYNGPDREAVKMLEEAGEEHLGTDFRDCPEFQDFVNAKYQGDEGKYLRRIGYNEEEDDKKFEETYVKVKSHELPKRVNEIKVMAGGRDLSGASQNDVIGGFGDERLRKPSEIKVERKVAPSKPKEVSTPRGVVSTSKKLDKSINKVIKNSK